MGRLSKKAGYAVIKAENGWQALDVLHSQVVDLAATGLWMSTMDGVELLKVLRVEFSKLTVFAGAPRAPIDMSAALATTGAQKVLYKPLTIAL